MEMKIEEQVCSREQMAELKKLGIDTSEASMCECLNNRGFRQCISYEGNEELVDTTDAPKGAKQ